MELYPKAKNRNRLKYSLLIANHAGFEMNGNLFGIGYIRGMMDTLEIPYFE